MRRLVEILDVRSVDRLYRAAEFLRLGFDGVELDTRYADCRTIAAMSQSSTSGANFLTWPTALATFSASSPACFRLVMNLSIFPVSGVTSKPFSIALPARSAFCRPS